MSDSAPTEPPAAPPAAGEPSESEKIRRALVDAISQGSDLRDKATRVKVCHDIETALSVPYGNVTKQVNAALKIAAASAGRPEEVSRQAGGAKVTIRVPTPSTPPEEPPTGSSGKDQPAPQASTEQPPAPAKPKMSQIYLACTEEQLRKTTEYRWLAAQIKMGTNLVDGIYEKFGLTEPGKGIMSQAPSGVDMVDMTVQMCMKYDWSVPDRLEKLAFFGAWGALLILPPLAKFGIIDDIKSGKLGGKKKDQKKSDEPLSDAGKKGQV